MIIFRNKLLHCTRGKGFCPDALKIVLTIISQIVRERVYNIVIILFKRDITLSALRRGEYWNGRKRLECCVVIQLSNSCALSRVYTIRRRTATAWFKTQTGCVIVLRVRNNENTCPNFVSRESEGRTIYSKRYVIAVSFTIDVSCIKARNSGNDFVYTRLWRKIILSSPYAARIIDLITDTHMVLLSRYPVVRRRHRPWLITCKKQKKVKLKNH